MRKNTLGQIEGRMGSDYYIIDNLPEDTRTFSTEAPEYNGIVLNNKALPLFALSAALTNTETVKQFGRPGD